ncbi:hypothetical protein OAX78_01780 [Planctomycetota bacterium]|nr:hypothetical protein [Planctomycetota bacterium]
MTPEPTTFRAYVVAGLDALHDEMPRAYRRLIAELGDREVLLRVGSEEVSVRFVGEQPPVRPAPVQPQVVLSTAASTIVALADAELTVEDAIWEDRVLLRGALPDLLAFHDALHVFLHGAVRSPSFSRRMKSFRRFCQGCAAQPPATVSQLLADPNPQAVAV